MICFVATVLLILIACNGCTALSNETRPPIPTRFTVAEWSTCRGSSASKDRMNLLNHWIHKSNMFQLFYYGIPEFKREYSSDIPKPFQKYKPTWEVWANFSGDMEHDCALYPYTDDKTIWAIIHPKMGDCIKMLRIARGDLADTMCDDYKCKWCFKEVWNFKNFYKRCVMIRYVHADQKYFDSLSSEIKEKCTKFFKDKISKVSGCTMLRYYVLKRIWTEAKIELSDVEGCKKIKNAREIPKTYFKTLYDACQKNDQPTEKDVCMVPELNDMINAHVKLEKKNYQYNGYLGYKTSGR